MTTILDAGLLIAFGLLAVGGMAFYLLVVAVVDSFQPKPPPVILQRPYAPGDVVNGHLLMADSSGYRWIPLDGGGR